MQIFCRIAAILFAGTALLAIVPAAIAEEVQQWSIFEFSLRGPASGNPFADVTLTATFTHAGQPPINVAGFYDGNGIYKLRFMPADQGKWRYQTKSNSPELQGKIGTFDCVQPTAANHGPVAVKNTFHFAYADGSPYFQIGTTCYGWTHEADEMEHLTLQTLAASPFNKLRMCVFPLRYPSKRQLYPFERSGNAWDFTRFNPEFFQHLEKRVGDLRDLNIEADLILFHPYERATGFNSMTPAGDERYVRYLIARLGAYRNVWWSLANEYDLLKNKTTPDWDYLFKTIVAADPYAHLRSIHFSQTMYNYTQPWVTHASIQNGSAVQDFGRAVLFRDVYNKPIVFDEVKYEGDVAERWGHLTPEEMTDEFWHATIDGTYVGHSETYGGDQNNWLSRGGKLLGKSPERIAFLKKIVDAAPATGIDPIDKWQNVHLGGKPGEYYLYYFGNEKPADWLFDLPRRGITAGMKFHVDILDTWNMTITPVNQDFTLSQPGRYEVHAQGDAKLTLPQKPYLALRITVER